MMGYLVIYIIVFTILVLGVNKMEVNKNRSLDNIKDHTNIKKLKQEKFTKNILVLFIFPIILCVISELAYFLIFKTIYHHLMFKTSIIMILTTCFIFSRSHLSKKND